MAAFNKAVTVVFNLLFLPFRGMSPWVGLVVISLLSGIVLLYIFKLTANQEAITRVKDRIRGNFLEIRLFQDDPGIIASAFGRIFLNNFIYMRYALVPMLFMIIPVLLILIQAEMRYGVRPARPGETVLLTIKMMPGHEKDAGKARLEIPDGIEIAAGPVRMASTGEADWELRAVEPGRHEITVSAGGSGATHLLDVSDDGGTPSVVRARVRGSAWEQLINPGAAPPPLESNLERIEIQYPAREMKLGGRTIHWLITFLVVSVIFGYSVKGLFGVEV